MLEVALQMPELFPSGTTVPIFKMRSSWPSEAGTLGKQVSEQIEQREHVADRRRCQSTANLGSSSTPHPSACSSACSCASTY